jgi:hypothetical protein
MLSGSVQAFHTSSRGASKTRMMTSALAAGFVAGLISAPIGLLLPMLFA